MSKFYDSFQLTSQIALVTGAAGLLGSGFCRILAKAGASVLVADIDEEGATLVAEEIQDDGLLATPARVDITDPISVDKLIETVLREYGGLNILVNSAALDPKFDPDHHEQTSNAFEDYPLEAWNQALDVNLTGMFLVSQASATPMLAQDRGVIINICSTYGLVGPDQRLYEREGHPPQFKPVYYSVTKAGVLGFTRYLATYYSGKNIRVNALTPGGVFNDHDDEFVEKYAARTVLGRMARRDELNGALLFLASDASSYMTGANLVVDGGWTAW
jgi:2-deoxy-D-gluconate 3-dehydrogenase